MKQWGSAEITLNPFTYGSKYLAVSYTMAYWGDIPTEGCPIPPEYVYYNSKDHQDVLSLSEMAVHRMMYETQMEWGMNNLYNSARFVYANNGNKNSKVILNSWASAYGASVTETSSGPLLVYDALRYLIENFMIKNATADITTNEMVIGFKTDLAYKVNTGDFFQGNVYSVTDVITPVVNNINNLHGELADSRIQLRTGFPGYSDFDMDVRK